MPAISYGGIEFPVPHQTTLSWTEEPQYSDDNLIYECTKINIGVQSVLTTQALSSSMQALGIPLGSTPGQLEAQLRSILNLPRQQLVVRDDNGNPILITPAAGTVADTRGGPFPKATIHPSGPNCWLIDFEVETYWTVCNAQGTAPDIVSHRFSTTIRYDKDIYASREVTGTLRISKQNDISPDFFRDAVVPELPFGFVRENMSYTVEESGDALKYSFTDRQVNTTPPVLADGSQATDIRGSYSEGTTDGVTFYSQLTVRVDGSKGTDSGMLFQAAAKIALAYVGTNGTIPDGALESAEFRTELETNMAEISVRVNKFLVASMSKDFGVDDSRLLIIPPGTESGEARDPGSRGEWLVGIVHAKLVSPNQVCAGGNVTPASVQSGSDDSPGYDNTNAKPKYNTVPSISPGEPSFSPAQLTPGEQYHEYMIDVHYVENVMNFMLPTAGAGPQIVQAAASVWYKIVKWTAERVGANPQAPAKETSDPNEVYCWGDVSPCAPQLNPDKRSYVIRVSGVYKYFLKEEPTFFKSGSLPYDDSDEIGQLGPEDFEGGIISD
jgi:hypothetical protein